MATNYYELKIVVHLGAVAVHKASPMYFKNGKNSGITNFSSAPQYIRIRPCLKKINRNLIKYYKYATCHLNKLHFSQIFRALWQRPRCRHYREDDWNYLSPNDDVVFLQIINSVLMAYWNIHEKRDSICSTTCTRYIIFVYSTKYCLHNIYLIMYLHFLKNFFKRIILPLISYSW